MHGRALRVPIEATLLSLMLLTAWAVHGANQWLEARQVEAVADGNVGVLPDGHVVRVLSLGFDRLVADLFWIRTTVYIGDEAASAAHWPGAERLADLVTDVDPHFDTPYVIMAALLGGLMHDHDAAIRVLEKGAAVSQYWRIHFLLGFEYFMEKQDYVRGAESLQHAIALGGPEYLQFLVSRLYASAGDPTTAMQFIALRLKNEETPQVREQLEQRLSDLWINRDLAQIDGAIGAYTEQFHHAPKDVRALVAAELLPALPHDPKGGEYSIDASGKAATPLAYQKIEVHVPGYRSRKGNPR